METQNQNADNFQNQKVSVQEIEQKEKKKDKRKTSLEIFLIGWAGTLLIVVAYSLNSLGYLPSTNIAYPILNLFGAFFLAIRVYSDRNWSNLLLEVFWAAIAVLSILKYFHFM